MREWLLAEFHWLFVMGLLVLVIAGCVAGWALQRQAWYYTDDEADLLRFAADVAEMQPVILPPIEDDPGDEWADELHAIGQDIAAEPAWSWRAEVMHRWKPVLALGQVTEEDVTRFYLADADYWALRRSEMRAWQAGNDEDEKRYLRSCVRRGWLVMEDLAA